MTPTAASSRRLNRWAGCCRILDFPNAAEHDCAPPRNFRLPIFPGVPPPASDPESAAVLISPSPGLPSPFERKNTRASRRGRDVVPGRLRDYRRGACSSSADTAGTDRGESEPAPCRPPALIRNRSLTFLDGLFRLFGHRCGSFSSGFASSDHFAPSYSDHGAGGNRPSSARRASPLGILALTRERKGS